MSNLVYSVSDYIDDYFYDIPAEIPEKSVKSFLCGFAVNFLETGGNPSYALTAGVFAIMATIVDAVVMPLFKWTFINPHEFLPLTIRKIVVVSLLAATAANVGGAILGMEVVIRAASTVVINLLLELVINGRNPTNEASSYYYVDFHPWLV